VAAVVAGLTSTERATSPLPQKLRVGIFAGTVWQPRWRVEACAKIAACEFAEISRLEAGNGAPQRAPWAFRVAERDEILDLSRYVSARESAELDVAFTLDAIDDSRLDGIARLGVWRLHADGVREVVEGAPLTACSLKVRLAAGDEARLAVQAWSRTERLSIAANRARVLGKAAELAVRGLRDAQRFGRGWLEQCKATPENQGQTTISVRKALTVIARNRGLSLISVLREAEEQYLALRRASGPIPPTLKGFTRLKVKGRTPFVFDAHVFFEQAGRIAVLADDQSVSLMEGSYPFVVEEGAARYLVSGNRLYRAIEFPRRWTFVRELVEDERLSRTTLHRAADRWWLFATGRFDDELLLYHAPRLAGPWTPHARNPVKSDARAARPAGRLYWRSGALYRPAEICVPREGAGVALHRVLRLTPHEYAERHVETIPGVRCIANAGELTAVDVVARRRRFA
jgi:hypothetical protein